MVFLKKLAGLLAKFFAALIWLMPIRVQMAIGAAIGILWFDVLRIRRRVALENLRRAFPDLSEDARIKIGRQSLISMGRTLVEFASFPFIDQATAIDRLEVGGGEIVRQQLARGKGVMFLAMHVGNGDLVTAYLSRLGFKMNLISKEFKSRWLNDMWFGMRRRHGTQFISAEKSSFEILRALRRNEMVIFVLDQFMGPPVGVRTKFFGHETGTAMGLALMAERTEAPVIVAITYRKPDGRHAVHFTEPIEPPAYLDNRPREENIAVMTQIYTDKIEAVVRQYPGQWMWIHRRWKEFRD